jgi:hypothetical protein
MITGPEEIPALPPGPAGQDQPATPPHHDGTRSAAPPASPAAMRFAAAARWAGGHLTVVIPATAAIAAYAFLSVRVLWLPALILTAIAALTAWTVTHRVVHRDRYRSRTQPRTLAGPGIVYPPAAGGFPAAAEYEVAPSPAPVSAFAAAKAAAAGAAAQEQDRQPSLPDTLAILHAAAKLITDLRPGPERITVGLPGDVQVQWDDTPGSHRNLDGARIDKMEIIVKRFRRAADDADLLHRFPQLWLISDTGAVIELFGDMCHGRTGTVITTRATAV